MAGNGPDPAVVARRYIVDAAGLIVRPVAGPADVPGANERALFGSGIVGQALVPHLVSTEYDGVAGIKTFSIRNGRVEDACDLLVQASIASTYHWAVIEGMTPAAAVRSVEMFIRAALVQWDAYPPGDSTADIRRKSCVVLGAARAAMTTYYDIANADLIPGEVGLNVLSMVPGATEDDAPTFTVNPNMTAAQRTTLSTPIVLSAGEGNAINTIVRCGLAAMALQGYSLVMCGHHYLSDPGTNSFKAFKAVENQLWIGQSVSGFFTDMTDRVRDVLWHKAGHPVLMTLKVEWAGKNVTKLMLEDAKLGSAAVRIPAEEAEMRAATSVLALISTLKPVIEGYGGYLDSSPLDNMVAEVRAASTEIPQGAARVRVSERMKKIADLKRLMELGKGMAAWCFGFYTRMMERDSSDSGKEVKDSLSASHYLRKLASDSMGAYQAGKNQYQNYESALYKARKQGIFKAHVLTYGQTPDFVAMHRNDAEAGGM